MAVLFSRAKGEYGKVKPFVSFAMLLAWHFCFWFSPASITFAPLLDLGVTESWLAYLLSSSCALLFAVASLRSSRRLKATPRASLGCAAVLSAASLAFSFGLFSGSPVHSYGLPSLIGASEALCFILWGEFFSREDYDVSPLRAIGAASSVLFVAVGLFAFLPPVVAPIVAALLPLASAFLSSVDDGDGKDGLSPVLKPAPMRKDALKNIATVSAISLVAGFACFHLITIVPLDDLVGGEWVYYNGVLAGTLSIFFVSLVGARPQGKPLQDPFMASRPGMRRLRGSARRREAGESVFVLHGGFGLHRLRAFADPLFRDYRAEGMRDSRHRVRHEHGAVPPRRSRGKRLVALA